MNPDWDVTVAIILHGEPPNIRRTISSLNSQNYTLGQVKILCLDDGTSPDARAVLDELGVWTVDLPSGGSISTAKNKALELSSNEFVFFLDDHIYLEPGGLQAAMEEFVSQPRLAGVCGYYQSPKSTDWNTLRDIKRHSIYGKSTERRLITLDSFTTFSTGIGIVRKSVFKHLDFPEDTFPPDFGGEDVPALLTALNRGHCFAYVPGLTGWHEHNLGFMDFLRKIEIEVRGRFSVFFWASGAPGLVIPYLHGFLNFPLLFYITMLLAIICFGLGWTWFAAFPAVLLCVEANYALRCLSTPISYSLRHRILATTYVLLSDLLTPLCALQYAVSSYKRPYPRLGRKRAVALLLLILGWERSKLTLGWKTGRDNRPATVGAYPQPSPSDAEEVQ